MGGMLIGLIRHGQTDWNRIGKIQGQTDIDLNATGIEEAEAVAKRIGRESWDLLYCSDMKRAVQTAECIREHHPNIPYFKDSRLRERNYGLIEGTTPEERIQRFGHDWKDKADELKMESEEQLFRRMASWHADMIQNFPDQKILVVTHGGFIRSMIQYLFHRLPEGWLGNGSLTILRFAEGHWSCERYNDLNHLLPMTEVDRF